MIQLNLKLRTLGLGVILLMVLPACHQQSSSHYLKNGSAKYQLQNFQGAIVDLDRAVELDANNAEAYYLRALCYSNINELDKAEVDFSKTISLQADYKEAYFNRAFYIYQKNGSYQKAIEDYNMFLQLKPSEYVAFALNNRGWSEYKLGMLNEALRDINQSVKKSDQNDLAFRNKAIVLFAMDSLDAACLSYQKAIELGFVSDKSEPLLDSLNLHCISE